MAFDVWFLGTVILQASTQPTTEVPSPSAQRSAVPSLPMEPLGPKAEANSDTASKPDVYSQKEATEEVPAPPIEQLRPKAEASSDTASAPDVHSQKEATEEVLPGSGSLLPPQPLQPAEPQPPAEGKPSLESSLTAQPLPPANTLTDVKPVPLPTAPPRLSTTTVTTRRPPKRRGKPRKNVLVIGGTYFLGITIIKSLLKADYNVTFVTRGSQRDTIARLESLGAIHVQADRGDRAVMQKAFRVLPFWFHAVIDMVAFEPKEVANLIHALTDKTEWGYRFTTFVSISSTAAYAKCTDQYNKYRIIGKDPLLHETHEDDVRDKEKCKTPIHWQYAIKKWEIDDLLRRWRERDMTIKGKRLLPFTTLLVPTMVGKNSLKGGNLDSRHYELQLLIERCDSLHIDEVHRPPRKYRHLAHDSHLAEAILGILRSGNKTHGEALNVAMPEALTIHKYLRAIAVALELPMPKIVYGDHGWRGGSIFFDDFDNKHGPLSIDRAKELIGYSPSPVQNWMNETARWWARHGRKLHSNRTWEKVIYSEKLDGACRKKWKWRLEEAAIPPELTEKGELSTVGREAAAARSADNSSGHASGTPIRRGRVEL